MKKILFLLLLSFHFIQSQEKSSPFKAVQSFFEAFHQKDSLGLTQAFYPNAKMQRAVYKNEKSILLDQDISIFIKRVANRADQPSWRESLGTPQIQVSSNMATVWFPFRFYLDEKLLHCGVNQFTLFWDGSHWKIIHLIDTSEACVEN